MTAGDLPIQLTWLKNGVQLNHQHSAAGLKVQHFDDFTSFLSIPSLRAAHSGTYTCRASNAAGSQTVSADLHVHGNYFHLLSLILFFAAPPNLAPVGFSSTVEKGGEVAEICHAESGDPPITLSWSKKGTRGLPPGVSTQNIGSNTLLLTIQAARGEHSGWYTCVASNAAGVAMVQDELVIRGQTVGMEPPPHHCTHSLSFLHHFLKVYCTFTLINQVLHFFVSCFSCTKTFYTIIEKTKARLGISFFSQKKRIEDGTLEQGRKNCNKTKRLHDCH